MSTVTAFPAATPAEAERHFAARLAFETDAADVGAAVNSGEPLDFVLVDVRSRDAYAAGHAPGAISLPHGEIDAATVAALPDGLVVVYCWGPGCNGAQHAGRKLAAHGRQVKEMLGGFEYYVREGWPIEGEQADAGLYDAGVDHGGLVRTPAAEAVAPAC
ncbi:MAG TPA: rhodanese-like domain-containing protein [Solirubrobacteraceae bacterium]|nr:rhodanese-like domain-containing protein [Solirubrobacteraceae bacterium]